MGIGCGCLWLGMSYMKRFGIGGLTDPYFNIFCICKLYVLVLTAAGFAGAFHTMKVVYEIIRNKMVELEFLNADGIGGLQFIADYILETSRLFATGLPWFFFI